MVGASRPLVVFSSWELGAYLDRWSLVHFAWGFMLATIFQMLGISKTPAYIIALSLMLFWEFYERFTGLYDYLGNSIFDIILASAGFWLMYRLWPKARFLSNALWALSILVATIFVKMWADSAL